MKTTQTHLYFWGSIYSQWSRCRFQVGEIVFKSAEQYMMYRKSLLFNDQETAKAILKAKDPKEQKALGRQVKGFKEDLWDLKKFEIVVQGNLYKFSQNEALKKELLATGERIIVEGSPYDSIWGVGLKWDDPKILDEKNWRGQNLLGKALMEVRRLLSAP